MALWWTQKREFLFGDFPVFFCSFSRNFINRSAREWRNQPQRKKKVNSPVLLWESDCNDSLRPWNKWFTLTEKWFMWVRRKIIFPSQKKNNKKWNLHVKEIVQVENIIINWVCHECAVKTCGFINQISTNEFAKQFHFKKKHFSIVG